MSPSYGSPWRITQLGGPIEGNDMTDVTTPGGDRRSFLKGSALLAGAAALTGFESLGRLGVAGAAPAGRGRPRGDGGYGPLRPAVDQTTGETLIALPRGFEYLTFGRTGEVMGDGIPTPSSHDGMAAFRKGDLVHVVRNHERGAGAAYAAGMTYNPAAGGGTSTLVFDPDAEALVDSYASLAGTIRNCGGGPTPLGLLAVRRGDHRRRGRPAPRLRLRGPR